jgi:hypothetical protein
MSEPVVQAAGDQCHPRTDRVEKQCRARALASVVCNLQDVSPDAIRFLFAEEPFGILLDVSG